MKGARKGSVLAMSVVVLTALIILGLALIARTRTVLDSSARERDRLLALNAAEAGANLAVYWLENDFASWSDLVGAHEELERTDLGNSYFEIDEEDGITWLSQRIALVRSDGYSRGGRSPQKRTVAVRVRLLPSGFRYAVWSGGSIRASGSSDVYGSMRANGSEGVQVVTGGSFLFHPLTVLDTVETPGTITDGSGGIPNQYEYTGAAVETMPDMDYVRFQDTALFPRARIYNVLPVDPTPGNDPFTDDDVATAPWGTGGKKGGAPVPPILKADGSLTWYYSYTYSGSGQVNDQWTVGQFNSSFAAAPTYLTGLPAKDYAIVNWRTGVDMNGDGTIDTYRLHISGNGTVTATIAIYGDSGDPMNPNDNGSLKISGGPTFEPATGVALVANGVDFEKVTGNAQFGTQANPALVYASGWSRWGSGGTVTTVGSVIIGGDGNPLTPDIDIIGASEHWFNGGFIDKMPENMLLPYERPSWYAQWLSWQVL